MEEEVKNIEWIYQVFLNSTGVSTDTRTIKRDNLFFALKGPSFDGNIYAPKALEKGALAAIVDDPALATIPSCILVENVLHTLQILARYHRRQCNVELIAVCGSNGKTTTKELIYAVLSTKFNTYATQGNLNNHIGVPITLLGINNSHSHAIIELGANHLGETTELCRISEPEYGIITNNGYDHLEGYGSIENVIKANAELYNYLCEHNGTAFVNKADDVLMNLSRPLKRVEYGLGSDNDGLVMSNDPYLIIKLKSSGRIVNTNLTGEFNLVNILCAQSIAQYFGIDDETILHGIMQYQPRNNRSQRKEHNGNTFIVDCYNANPSSMEAALESFNNLPGKNKVAILGDMFELGDYTDALHRSILKRAHEMRLSNIVLIGDYFSIANDELKYNYLSFKTTNEAKHWLESQKGKEILFLLKASRGIALEEIIE